MTAPLDPEGRESVLAGHDVSREAIERLDRLVALFAEWRTRLNLMGPREYDRIWSRHIDDSLQLLALMDGANGAIDLGSGGGFPGLVLAATAPQPFEITLVESVGKKCAFLSEAVDTLGIPATVVNSRVETLDAKPIDVISARAFAPLPKLLEYAAPWFRYGAFGLFHKGKSWQEEIDEASRTWSFRHEVIPSRTSETGVILKLSEVSRDG